MSGEVLSMMNRARLTPFGLWLFGRLFPAGPAGLHTMRGVILGPVTLAVEPDVTDVWAWHGRPHRWRRWIEWRPASRRRQGRRLLRLPDIARSR